MDLSAIQEILDMLADFGGAIGDFLQKPYEIIGQIVGWFDGEGADLGDHAETTSSAFGSSADADVATGEEAPGEADAAVGSSFDVLGSSGAAGAATDTQ